MEDTNIVPSFICDLINECLLMIYKNEHRSKIKDCFDTINLISYVESRSEVFHYKMTRPSKKFMNMYKINNLKQNHDPLFELLPNQLGFKREYILSRNSFTILKLNLDYIRGEPHIASLIRIGNDFYEASKLLKKVNFRLYLELVASRHRIMDGNFELMYTKVPNNYIN